MNQTIKNSIQKIREWRPDVFLFAEEALNMKAAEPIDELRGKAIHYTDGLGNRRSTILFDVDGRLVYPDLSFYTIDMFKHQGKGDFKKYKGTRFTWQQTIELEAYNRGLATFNKDSYNIADRWISIRSGHGIGKTSFLSVASLHFLICYFGSQVGVTSNSEDQLKDIFLKELSKWKAKLPDYLTANMTEEEQAEGGAQIRESVEVLDTFVRIAGQKDWFLRARVARPEKPEALAGLHGEFILIIVDEASAVHDKVFETMKGALTGENFIVIYTSNPTRNEGEFFNSHKKGAAFTQLHFTSRQSPIVKDGYIEKMEEDYPSNGEEPSDEVKIRVDGEFAGVSEMDDKGWIPLFANVKVLFEPDRGQHLSRPIIGVDPAGRGRDSSIIVARDPIYLKEVLNEKTSSEPDLARKVETVRDSYGSSSNDIGIEAFGIGAKVVANVQTKVGESVNAILTDKPREETKDKYHTYKAELAWAFRTWCLMGGIIITNKQAAWVKELEKIKYKRDAQGRIQLMDKVTFKKEYGFSPDRFDAAITSFFKNEPTMPVVMTKAQLEAKETQEWLQKVQQAEKSTADPNFSSM